MDLGGPFFPLCRIFVCMETFSVLGKTTKCLQNSIYCINLSEQKLFRKLYNDALPGIVFPGSMQ
jgi:hypothetical protein